MDEWQPATAEEDQGSDKRVPPWGLGFRFHSGLGFRFHLGLGFGFDLGL